MDLINEQLGKLLLLAALVLGGGSITLYTYQPLEPLAEAELARAVMVELDTSTLATASPEVFFAAGPASKWAEGRSIIEEVKREKQYVPVDLDIPPASVMRPPQLLPEPGPALEGTQELPRFGDEFPPLAPAAPADPKKQPLKTSERAP